VLVNQKGGVGKTTVTLNLAAAAGASGRRVLVVDLDPQANATTGMGVWSARTTIDDVLADPAATPAAAAATSAVWPEAFGPPDIVPSTPVLANREPLLAADPVGAQDRLRTALGADDHDLVLVDCPPSLGLLTINGLFAADQVLVVTEPAAWAADGVDLILGTLGRVSDRRAEPLPVCGIVVNRLGRTRDARYWLDQLAQRHGALVLPPVQLRTAVAEAAAQSLPVAALGTRRGAAEAAAEFDALLEHLDGAMCSAASALGSRSVGGGSAEER